MAYDVPQLLKMSQAELDALFTASEAGPIPEGQADGTAIIAPGTTFSPEIAEFVNHFAWQGKVFDPKSGTLRNRDRPTRAERDRRPCLQGAKLARRQGMHCARLLGDIAGRALGSR